MRANVCEQEERKQPRCLTFFCIIVQVAKRISHILWEYVNGNDEDNRTSSSSSNSSVRKRGQKNFPKTICFCGTPSNCETLRKTLFEEHEVPSEVFTGKTSMNERNRIVSSLLSGKISVVCATKGAYRFCASK